MPSRRNRHRPRLRASGCAAGPHRRAGTPKDVVGKLNGEINKALAAADVRAKLSASGIEIQGGTPAAFADYIKAEVVKWAKVTKDAGIEPE